MGVIGPDPEGVKLPEIATRPSLAVTDSDVMSAFTLKEVMQQLLTQAESSQTPSQLFFQMFDAQQPADAPGAGPGPHCTDTFNGFSFQCPRFEGTSVVNRDPFIEDQTASQTYKAVALMNRFDLVDAAGAHCGQYRIVFARRTADQSAGSLDRNFIIFEAQVPNPRPEQGAFGCAPIAQFWQNLAESDRAPAETRSALHKFYFDGLPASGVGPVVHIDNYGGGKHGGQIRTNQFSNVMRPPGMPFQTWLLREYTLNVSCATPGGCSVVMNPATAKNNPSATLFVPGSTDPVAIDFQTNVLLDTNVLSTLASAKDINELVYDVPDRFNTGESNAMETGEPLPLPLQPFTAQRTDYLAALGTGRSKLADEMEAKLASIGSTLTAQQIVNRIQSLSCAGCHNVNVERTPEFPMDHSDLGLSEPWLHNEGFNFTHTSETEELIPAAEGGDGTRKRFMLSPLVNKVFLPFRKERIEAYAADLPRTVAATLKLPTASSSEYCAVVTVHNGADTPTTAWHVDIDLNGATVTSSWPDNVRVAAGTVSASNLASNGAIPARSKLSEAVGFCATRASDKVVPRVLAASGE